MCDGSLGRCAGHAFEPQRGPLNGLGSVGANRIRRALVAESCIHARGPQAGLRVALVVAPRPVVRLAPWTKREQRELLAMTEGHVARGERHIARQHEIIAELTRDGHDITRAEALLAAFEQTQRLHVADRDRLKKELNDASRT
jgi:antitoxin (DNA-binding transcriptional repressor) of toxin-antitoxin stability system